MNVIPQEKTKVLLAIFSKNEKILHVKDALRELNCNVKTFYTDSYETRCTYIMKKINEVGIHNKRDEYYRLFYKKLTSVIDEFSPNLILFINIPVEAITICQFKSMASKHNIVCWFVDSLKKQLDVIPYLRYLKNVYVFEEADVMYLHNLGVKAIYLPVGYNSAFRWKHARKDIDILFIGSPFRHRLKVLERLAKEALIKKWKVKIIGPFFSKKYPWKKMFFQRKYPHIYHYLDNRRVSPEEAAELYARTKICLNIHTIDSKSPNPRTFEILATGSFELIDIRSYWGGLRAGVDLESYRDVDDLIEKVNVYLENPAKRNKIALAGYQHVHDKMSMRYILQKVIKMCQ